MNLFKNYTIIVFSACIDSVIMEEQYQTLNLGVRTAVTGDKCALLGCYAASSGNFLLTSVRNYHYPPRNNPEECRFHLPHSRSVKSRSS